MYGLVSSFVAVALFRQDSSWDTKSDSSIDASPFETSFGFALFGVRMEGLAALEAEQSEPEHAVRLLGAAEALREAIGAPIYPLYRANYEQALALARAKQDPQTFAALWAEGRGMTVEQALALATRLPATTKAAAPLPSPTIQPPSPASVRLTRREREVLQWLTAGLTNPEIAQRLVVSLPTVNTHVAAIFKKLGVNSRAAATRYAIEHQLA
jgi:DNA-binding CsgD family transcriptional regulator